MQPSKGLDTTFAAHACGGELPWPIWQPVPALLPARSPRLEKGDPGVGIGTLADILVALGLIERLADLVDIRKDDLGLALASEQLPRRGKTYAAKLRKQNKLEDEATAGTKDVVDPDGAAF